jgi:hypothetical protein
VSERRFKITHVGTVPASWRVRTKVAGKHRIRIAYPPGPRRKGSGRVIEVLHPRSEPNPCHFNPAELVVMGANPFTEGQRVIWQTAYGQDKATIVKVMTKTVLLRLDRGGTISVPKSAVQSANPILPNPAELVIMGANPHRRRNAKRHMDTFMRGHLKLWLADTVHSSERRHVGKIIRAYVSRYPEIMAESRSWPEIRRMAETEFGNPSSRELDVPTKHQIKIAKATLRMSDVGARIMGGMTKEQAREILSRHGIRFKENATGVGHGSWVHTPGRAEPNPKIRVSFDPAVKKFVAVTYHKRFGNLFMTGATKAEARAALKSRIAQAEAAGTARNPGYVYFEMNGIQYRTDGVTVEGKDGSSWNRTGSLPVVLAARAEFKKRGPANILPAGTPPPRRSIRVRNPEPAAELYEQFHGRPVQEVIPLQESEARRTKLTALGRLEKFTIRQAPGQPWGSFTFSAGDKVTLASSPNGKQIYLVGGNQDISPCLRQLDTDASKDFVEIGEVMRVFYQTEKGFDGFERATYFHDLGEKSGKFPTAVFDKLRKRIFFIGGEYEIKPEGIVN